ncbi:hypothetical protein CWI38_0776p0020 [Hamiltosporidium tvaerminnensis]|uniref:NodB homology domain-containing protein n=1 Tax=Hamiltosporidium tvaerminnensis TaxID=1176355 RepID=A0A4Q9LUQ5_9MICR|nr:hypothetical protein CWI38_0776p0020 [Hamiltosporidium tvaerminnensis]
MLSLILSILLLINIIQAECVGQAIISYDEGPTDKIVKILEISENLNVPIVFHFCTDSLKKNLDVFKNIKDKNVEIGISITDDLYALDIDLIKEIIISRKKEFEELTGYTPILLRLPRSFHPSESKQIAEDLGFIVTDPLIDSEDVETPNYICLVKNEILQLDKNIENFSIVFRERIDTSVSELENFIEMLKDKEFTLTKYSTLLNRNTDLIPIIKKNEEDIEEEEFKDEGSKKAKNNLEKSEKNKNGDDKVKTDESDDFDPVFPNPGTNVDSESNIEESDSLVQAMDSNNEKNSCYGMNYINGFLFLLISLLIF